MGGTGEAGITELDEALYRKDIEGMEDVVVAACCKLYDVQPCKVRYGRMTTRRQWGHYMWGADEVVLHRAWMGVLIHEVAHYIACKVYGCRSHNWQFKGVLDQCRDWCMF